MVTSPTSPVSTTPATAIGSTPKTMTTPIATASLVTTIEYRLSGLASR